MKIDTNEEGKISSQSDATLILNIEPFDISKPLEWNDYVEFVELNFAANNIDTLSDAQQVIKFLATAGRSIFELVRCLVAPASFRDFSLAEIKARLAKHFLPSDNVLLSTHTFYWRKMLADESLLEYGTVLKDLSVSCNFGQYQDRALRDQFIFGLNDPEVRDHVLRSEKDLSFDETVTMAQDMLEIKPIKSLSSETTITTTSPKTTAVTKNTDTAMKTCMSCGESHERIKCPFRTSVCDFCKVSGHVVSACMRRKKTLKITKAKNRIKSRAFSRSMKRKRLKSKASKISAISSD